jgi:23S rRNA pseudouridine955/2504/2580 synthase
MAAIGHPIVGDGKYGGQAAFLSGSISRKLHLHARRLRIEHPEGDLLDVTAPLPEHFSKSLEQLGFTESEGDLPLEAPVLVDPKTQEKRVAKAHAKQYRKERRGERRKRADGPDAGGGRRPTGQRAKVAGKPVGKPGAKPAGKPGVKLAGKPASKAPAKAPARRPAPKGPAQKGPTKR